jgi:hypothetical protein
MLHDIYQGDTRAQAEESFDLFLRTFEAKHPKATDCLAKDRTELLAESSHPRDRSYRLIFH